jgi:hypothetical protein
MSAVYFIQCGQGGPIKIGISDDLPRRLSKMQADCPFEMIVLGIMPGGVEEEMALHERFSAFRIRGEWFWPARELANYVSDLNPPERRETPPAVMSASGNPMRALRNQMGLTQMALASRRD